MFQKAFIATGILGALGGAGLFLGHVTGSTQIALTLTPPALDDGLVGHWTFDGKDMPSGQVSDISGQGSHGSQRNMSTSTAYARGAIGQALGFDGSNDYIDLGTSAALQPESLTASVWVRRDASWSLPGGGVQFLNGKGDVGWDSDGWYAELLNEALQLVVDGANYGYVSGTLSNLLPLNEWVYLAFTFDTGTNVIKIYRNAVEQSVGIVGSPSTITSNANRKYIGRPVTGGGYFPVGALDDVRIYNRALSADEIKHLYQLGATTKVATTPQPPPLTGAAGGLVGHWTFDGKDMPQGQVNDRSGQGNHGSMVDMASSTAYSRGVIGQALQFDGNNDRIDTTNESDYDFTTEFSASMWIKTTDSDGTFNAIMGKYSGGGSGWDFGLQTGKIRTALRGTSEIHVFNGQATVTVSDGAWHHIAVVNTNSGITQYVDGALDIERTGTWTATTNDTPMRIGNRDTIATFFDGALDDVRIYNRALSASEVTQLYQMGR